MLHLLAMIGGWHGALVMQSLLRHKSAKASFKAGFWLTVILNCGALVWLLGPTDADLLRALSGIM